MRSGNVYVCVVCGVRYPCLAGQQEVIGQMLKQRDARCKNLDSTDMAHSSESDCATEQLG